MTANESVPLTGGRMTAGVTRRGSTVRRPTGPWSSAVHDLLRYLERAGFSGAPRLLAVEGEQEVLSYLEGSVPLDTSWEPGRGFRLAPYARTSHALAGAGKFLRELHSVAVAFVPSEVNYRYHPHPPRPGEIVSHGDVGPWNTVYRAGIPVAFIDWDGAQPVTPLAELAAAAWAFVPLAPPSRLRQAGFDPLPDLPDRLRTFVDAYGLRDRKAILPALTHCRLNELVRIAHWQLDTAGAAGALEFVASELRWLDSITAELAAAL